MPERNWGSDSDGLQRAKDDPQAPYELVAVGIGRQILDGMLVAGDVVPPVRELAKQHGVSPGTVNRAMTLLMKWGLVSESGRGHRAKVLQPTGTDSTASRSAAGDTGINACSGSATGEEKVLLDLRLLCLGTVVRTFKAQAVLGDPDQIQGFLEGAARRHHGGDGALADYELEVRHADTAELIGTFAAL